MNSTPLSTRKFDTRALVQILIIDLVLYGLLFWRDYGDPAQMVIAHYISFIAVTDLAVFFLPMHQRRWFNWFRLSSALAFLVLVFSLYSKGLDGESLTLTLVRVAFVLARVVHSSLQLRQFGPGHTSISQFPGEDRLDDILTGLQAQAGLNFAIKMYVFEVLVGNVFNRFRMRALLAYWHWRELRSNEQ